MNREREDKIIAQAQDILEKRMAVETGIKVNLRKIAYYGAYFQGAQAVAYRLAPYVMQNYRGDDKIYVKAELDLIASSKRNMELWLEGTEIRFRNHKRNKKGKLESCEAYFAVYKSVIQEVK